MNSNLSIKFTLQIYSLNLPFVAVSVGNKAKGRTSNRVFQETKACQNFRKTNISYRLIQTRTSVNDTSSKQHIDLQIAVFEVPGCFRTPNYAYTDIKPEEQDWKTKNYSSNYLN